jgi:NAD(P)-dependent dehydrogenase (short-subunit alcohol dehydrogenase family)
MDPTARNNALERIPLKRFGTVEEIAEATLFLAKNEYANNCVINLDGGLSAAVSLIHAFLSSWKGSGESNSLTNTI